MQRFTVVVRILGYVTCEGDPESRWDRDDTAADIYVDGVRPVGSDDYYDVTLPSPMDESKRLYLLWADYDTGDSFGRDCNRFEAIDLFQSYERAQEASNALNAGESYSVDYARDDGSIITYCRPWVGYFENLNALHVEEVGLV